MPIDTISLVAYAVTAVLVIAAFWLATRYTKFWNSFRKLDRRQRTSPRAAATAWLLIGAGLAPFAYHTVETSIPFLLGAAGFVFGLNMLAVYASNRDWAAAHRDTPRSNVRTVDYGQTIVSGTVSVPDDTGDVDTIDAPVSQEPCVAYLSSINETRWVPKSNRTGGRRTTAPLALDEDATPFYLEDGTDRILVEPDGADLLMSTLTTPLIGAEHSTSETVPAGEEPPADLQAYEDEIGVSTTSRREQRYSETRIEPGDTVYVIGDCQQVTGTKYQNQNTMVIAAGNDMDVTIVVQEPYEEVDASFESFTQYYLYAAGAATVTGYLTMVWLAFL